MSLFVPEQLVEEVEAFLVYSGISQQVVDKISHVDLESFPKTQLRFYELLKLVWIPIRLWSGVLGPCVHIQLEEGIEHRDCQHSLHYSRLEQQFDFALHEPQFWPDELPIDASREPEEQGLTNPLQEFTPLLPLRL